MASPGKAGVIALMAALLLAHVLGIALTDRNITRGQIVAGDGLFYYEYVPSMILDFDLDFSNQRAAVHQLGIPYTWQSAYLQSTPTGLPGTPFPVGWALLTAPFFVLAHGLSLALAAAGFAVRLDGYGFIDQFGTNLGAVILGLAGIYLCFRTLREYFDDLTGGVAVASFVVCSNLPYYVVVHASMSHSVAFFCTAWSTWCFVRLLNGHGSMTGFGVASGLTLLTRPQLLPVIGLLYLGLLWQRPRAFGALFAAGLVALAIVSLQFIAWKIIHGGFFVMAHGNDFLQPFAPHLAGVLFSLKHGFISWTPFMAVALVGLVVGALSEPQPLRLLYVVAILAFAAEVYVNAIALDWWGGNAFGYRRLIEVYPLLMFGVARLLTLGRTSFRTVAALAVVCAVFNALFFVQYRFCYIPRDEPITLQQLTVDKLLLHRLERPHCQAG